MQIDPNPSASASTWPLRPSFGFTWDPHNRWVNVCIAFCFTIEICTAPQFLETWWSGCFVPIQMSSWWMDNWRSEPGTKGRLDNQENTEACWMSLVFHLKSKLFNNVEGPLKAQLSCSQRMWSVLAELQLVRSGVCGGLRSRYVRRWVCVLMHVVMMQNTNLISVCVYPFWQFLLCFKCIWRD